MSDKEWSPANVLDLFGDSITRAMLVVANGQSVSVKHFANELDVSDPTIYRRITPLVDANLLTERRRIDQHGNQHKEYETTLDEVTFAIQGDGYVIDIQIKQDLADDFNDMWTDLEQTGGQRTDSHQGISRSRERGSDLS